MKFLLTNINSRGRQEKLPLALSSIKIGAFELLSDDFDHIFESENVAGITEGYIRDRTLKSASLEEHSGNCYNKIVSGWPLPENITGSFSSLVIEKIKEEIIICNDCIGLYPLYYYIHKKELCISNSIILLAVFTGADYDEVGIIQRSIGHDFSNIGSRTIIENCKRILPGEYIRFNKNGEKKEKRFDNTLYQKISSPDQQQNGHKKYWEAYKKEVELCLLEGKEVKVALSGGIDSRIALGAIPEDKDVTCYTFGSSENYESKIAARLAKLKSAKFKACYQPELYFPTADVLRNYTLKTEAVQICSWLEIMENVESESGGDILLGELCEALPARNIKKFSTREFRRSNFFRFYILNKDYEFEKATDDSFSLWKRRTVDNYLIWYGNKRLKNLKFKITGEELKKEVKKDLEELFARIEVHNLPYTELFDELFSWYTFSRMRLAKQLLITKGKFQGYCPAMSLHVMRNTSNIHPNLRLNYRFAKKLFKIIPELRKFRGVPTSQAPLIPQFFPDFIKFPVWGLRSKIDSFLIRRMMKSKRNDLRYRLFKSIDWVRVYQNPNMETNLKAYFKNNHLGADYFKSLYNKCIQRKVLKQWPFANIDIINSAALNIEIDIIKRSREDNEV